MNELNDILNRIGPPDEPARNAAKARWDSIAKPLGSLGLLEDTVAKIAALRGTADVQLRNRTLLVFCADNGVVAQGVTQCGSEVTAQVAIALAENRSTANALARNVSCRVLPVDMGIRDFPGHPGVLDRRVRNTTADLSLGPAMTREECLLAIRRGAALAAKLAEDGADLLAVGEMGIGNTTTAAALSAALLGLSPEETVGRGAGLDSAGLTRKREVVRRALDRLDGREDVIDWMAKLGGLDIAGMCGAYLGAAACRVPAIIDGSISATAALCALRMFPEARHAMLASHVSAEPAGKALLDALGLKAPIDARLHLGEGGGALMLMPLLDMALAVYDSGQSFARLGIEAYQALT